MSTITIITVLSAIKRIFLVLWVLCEQSQLEAAFGDELVELLLSFGEITHLLL